MIYSAPALPKNHVEMFGMNIFALQLNLLSDALKAKLPPTDSRLRPDIRAWEGADLKEAEAEKDRLEINQRKRRNAFKEFMTGTDLDIGDERTYYEPKFFTKQDHLDNKGKTQFTYVPKKIEPESKQYLYWDRRDEGKWTNSPEIFDDACEPFY